MSADRAGGERLDLRVKLAYAAPSVASSGLALPIFALMPRFYSDNLMVPLGLIALAIALARAFDAITDPAMGWLSDRTQSRWGRRRPWIALGVPFTALSMIAMFAPPELLGPNGGALWFGITFGLYFLFHTIYFVPYHALGFELTSDYHQRSSLFGWVQAAGLVGTCIAGATPALIDTVFSGRPRTGYVAIGLLFSVLLIVLFGWLVLRVRERPEFMSRESNPLVPGVRRSLRNRPFRILLLAYAIFSLTGAIPGTVAPFYIPYVLKPENEFTILSITIVGYVVAGALSIPLWVRLAQRIGKQRAWYISIWIGILASLPFAFLGPGDTGIFLVCVTIAGTGLGSGLLHPSMQADVIDYDELHTGKRREAQYASFWSIVPKFVAIPSAALPLAILAAVGYVPKQEQPAEVLFALRALLGLAGPAVSLVAFFVALRFPMTEERHRAVLEGIAAHGRGEPARDPLTGRWLPAPARDLESEDTGWFLDHFSHGELRAVVRSGLSAPLARVLASASVTLLACLASAGWVVLQIGDLSKEPGIGVTLGVVAAGFAFSGFVFHALRVRPALRLRRSALSREAVELHLRLDPLDPEEPLPASRSAVS